MAKETLYVIDGNQKVPFLRGMITHSLVKRGLSFQQAYEAASLVRAHIRKKHRVIDKAELTSVIQKIVRDRFGRDYSDDQGETFELPPAIIVKGRDSEVPFSKGILSQSLQASGLEPSISYEVAQEIEGFLLEHHLQGITRDALRRLIYETILQHHDPDFAERYLLWRCFKSPDKPLILLFGGATGTGKSTLANEVAHRLGIQKVLSTDTIRQIMRMMLSRDLLPAVHSSSYEAWKELAGAGESPSGAAVEAFKEQTLRVLVGVRAMVERAIQENISLVIDGVHLVPGLMELEPYDEQSYLVPLVISTRDRSAYLDRFPIRQQEATSRTAQRYRDNFETILRIQDYILQMAKSHHTPMVDNKNFDETVTSILTVISNTLKEKLNLDREDLIRRAL